MEQANRAMREQAARKHRLEAPAHRCIYSLIQAGVSFHLYSDALVIETPNHGHESARYGFPLTRNKGEAPRPQL